DKNLLLETKIISDKTTMLISLPIFIQYMLNNPRDVALMWMLLDIYYKPIIKVYHGWFVNNELTHAYYMETYGFLFIFFVYISEYYYLTDPYETTELHRVPKRRKPVEFNNAHFHEIKEATDKGKINGTSLVVGYYAV
ncbi:hypothetical protein ACJX0J_028150, partial [Zea mays]